MNNLLSLFLCNDRLAFSNTPCYFMGAEETTCNQFLSWKNNTGDVFYLEKLLFSQERSEFYIYNPMIAIDIFTLSINDDHPIISIMYMPNRNEVMIKYFPEFICPEDVIEVSSNLENDIINRICVKYGQPVQMTKLLLYNYLSLNLEGNIPEEGQ